MANITNVTNILRKPKKNPDNKTMMINVIYVFSGFDNIRLLS